MPDARLQRTRATLPEGYQYGDARPKLTRSYADQFDVDESKLINGVVRVHCPGSWRAPHENAAEQLKREAEFRKKYMEPAIEHTFNCESQRTGDEAV